MARRDDIVIRYGGDDSRFQKVTKRVRSTSSGLISTFKNVGSTLLGAFGVGGGLAAGGIAASVAKLTADLDELGKTAKGLNTTVEALSALQFAVSQTSTLTDRQLNTSLQKLVKHVGQANRDVTSSQAIFTELGLSWEYLETLDSDKVFLEITDAINRLPTAYQQASVAQKLFEDNWRALLPTLTTSREEIEAIMSTAAVKSTEAAEAAARLNDQMGRFNQALEGMAVTYGPPVIEFLSHFIEVVTGSTGATDKIGQLTDQINILYQEAAKVQGEGFLGALSKFVTTADQRKQKLKEISSELGELIKQRQILIDQQAAAKNKLGSAPEEALLEEAKTGKTKTGKKTGGVKVETDWREKSVEELGAALKEFRDGTITAVQLGVKAGLQPPETAELLGQGKTGAYGTQSNTLANQGAIGAGGSLVVGPDEENLNQQFEAYFASRKFDVQVGQLQSEEASLIKVAPDALELTKNLERFFAATTFDINVRPHLVGTDGIEWAAQDEADKRGGRQ